MKAFLTILFFGFISVVSAQDTLMTKFDSLLERAQINFKIPEGLHELEIPFLHKIPHHIAIGPADSSYQVRYWIRPLDTWVTEYDNSSKKEEMMNPNDLCKSMMTLAVLDASNNKSQDYQVFDFPAISKKVYNADWEANAIVVTGWPQVGYKYCYIWCIHKDDIADIYVYSLSDSKIAFIDISVKILTAIKFK